MPAGFFETNDIAITRGDEKIKTTSKRKEVNCASCGLHNSCKNPKMEYSGKGNLKILIVGEYPTSHEDIKGTHFTGDSGDLLKDILKDADIDLHNDCWKTNAVICKPKKDTPSNLQIMACRKFLKETIKELQPKVIIALGKIAMDGLVGDKLSGRVSGISMIDWNGEVIPDQYYKCFIIPTWHPIYVIKNSKGNILNKVLIQQMLYSFKKAKIKSTSEFPIYEFEKNVTIVESKNEAIEIIKEYMNKKQFAFDYETTGKKPYKEGHEIYTASISDGKTAYSFHFFNDEEFRTTWKELMLSSSIKINHNKKFEQLWTKTRAGFNNTKGYWPKNINIDTMLNAHSLNNNKKVNLKFSVYCNFGIIGYDSEIEHYLTSSSQDEDLYGANAFNKIKQAPLKKLLLYNGMDSILTYNLYKKQEKQITDHLRKGIDFFNEGINEISKIEATGISWSNEGSEKEFISLTKKMNKIEKAVLESNEVKKYWDKKDSFSISNTNNLTYILFEKMKIEVEEKTTTGRPKGDIETLEKYDVPIIKLILKWRKWKKVRDTYLKGFSRESIHGLIHTSLRLYNVDTYRSSSSDPNLQNVPSRDIEVVPIIRTNITSRKGFKLAEYDYKAMEAVIIACYNHDPKWIEYVSDVNNDMHRDMGAKVYIRNIDEVLKEERFYAKNKFVFPTVYGSYWKNTANNLWQIGKETKNHLKEKGIYSLDDFSEHVKEVENWFWHEQFPVGYKWMQETISDYDKKGYIELLTGFVCKGPMTRNQIINYRVQGTASHCKLWTMIQVNKEIQRLKLKSKILLEIHDSIIVDIWPDEEHIIDTLMWKYGTQRIRKNWSWLIVPLFIEKKISEIDGNWASMKTIGLLNQ